MKKNLLLLAISLLFSITSVMAQKDEPVTFINGKISIAKYHEREELNRMKKGALIKLYLERVESIVNVMPNIAFAKNANVTMEDIGMPKSKENIDAVNENKIATKEYSQRIIELQRDLLAYCDKGDLIIAILFYEATLKSFNNYGE